MSRRCKAGKRARLVSGPNAGTVVLVVKALYTNEHEGITWPFAVFPWVITSLGRPLYVKDLVHNRPLPPRRTIVACDRDLEPLDDDDDGLTTHETTERPKQRNRENNHV